MIRYRIFIASTIEELREARSGVDEQLRRTEVFEPIRVEDLPASEEPSRRVCLREVAEADAVVLILKDRYGFVPESGNPEKLSVTHLEYREARRLRKPVFAFLSTEAHPEPGLVLLTQELSDFDEGVFRERWSTTEELREAVHRALVYWIARRARENRSEELRQLAATELGRDLKLSQILVIPDATSFQGEEERRWLQTMLDELAENCTRLLLPTPCLTDSRLEGNTAPALHLRSKSGSRPGRIDLAVELTESRASETPVLPLELDAARTDEGARFVAQCFLTLVLIAAKDWERAIEKLLDISGHRSASNRSRARLLATAAYVSATNQGQRSVAIVERMLDLPKLESPTASAGVMALVAAELRLEHAKARRALGQIQGTAIRLLKTALDQEPTAGESLYNLARRFIPHGPGLALPFFEQLVQTDPSYDERWYFHRDLGIIHYQREDLDAASQHYDRACHLKDNDSELFRFAGDAHYCSGRWAEALLRYERAVGIEPMESRFLDLKISFCRARLRSGKERETSLRRRRVWSHWLSNLGVRTASAGQRWIAQPLFRIAIRLCDLNYDAHNALALYANRRGAYAEAAAHLKGALAVIPENPSARLNLVMNRIFLNDGRFDDCAKDHARIAVFHGGPETLNRFRLRLTNTRNKDKLLEELRGILEVVRSERDEWIERRREVLKPEMFGGIVHMEFRP